MAAQAVPDRREAVAEVAPPSEDFKSLCEALNVKDFYVAISCNSIQLPFRLRRTLVRSYLLLSKSQTILQVFNIHQSTKHRSLVPLDDKQECLLVVRNSQLSALRKPVVLLLVISQSGT